MDKEIKKLCFQAATRFVSYPFSVIQIRMETGLNAKNLKFDGIIECADEIEMNEGGWAFWRGYYCEPLIILLHRANPNPQNQVFLVVAKSAKFIILMLLSCSQLMLKADVQNKFNNNFIAAIKHAFTCENRIFVLQGFCLMRAIEHLRKKWMAASMNNRFANNIRNNKVEVALTVSSLFFVPIACVCHRMIINQCSFTEAIKEGSLWNGLWAGMITFILDYRINSYLNFKFS